MMKVSEPLTIEEMRAAVELLTPWIRRTPLECLHGTEVEKVFGRRARVYLKLELFQVTGTFKARAALLNALSLSPQARGRGITAISAGNHAKAVAFAARELRMDAKVVMTASANPLRIERCRQYGAEVVIAPNAHAGFVLVDRIAKEEGRALIHPFDGRTTALGTATLGVELVEQLPEADAVIVPIGGGGLCAGVASAIKLLNPRCQVYGVEPFGADSMWRSFAAGEPRAIEPRAIGQVTTIADSLGAPYALPTSFEMCRRNVDRLVRVTDDELRHAMRFLMHNARLAVEPAGAAATAALLGPLRTVLQGRAVVAIVCGSNIDLASWIRLVN